MHIFFTGWLLYAIIKYLNTPRGYLNTSISICVFKLQYLEKYLNTEVELLSYLLQHSSGPRWGNYVTKTVCYINGWVHKFSVDNGYGRVI